MSSIPDSHPLALARAYFQLTGTMPCCGLRKSFKVLDQVSAVVGPSLGVPDPSDLVPAVRAGDGAAEPTTGRALGAVSRSPRTSPRRARNSERSDARQRRRDGWRVGMATSHNSRRGRNGRSDEGGTTNRWMPGTRHSPGRSVVPPGRSGSRQPSISVHIRSVIDRRLSIWLPGPDHETRPWLGIDHGHDPTRSHNGNLRAARSPSVGAETGLTFQHIDETVDSGGTGLLKAPPSSNSTSRMSPGVPSSTGERPPGLDVAGTVEAVGKDVTPATVTIS